MLKLSYFLKFYQFPHSFLFCAFCEWKSCVK